MLKGKLKLPDKARKAFPDRLGSLVAGFDDKDEEHVGLSSVFEFGEELETFQPNALGSDKESTDHNDGGDGFVDEKMDGVGESDFRVRKRPDWDPVGSVSVMEAIVADEKRSDLEYELSQPEINLEKLQRVATTGLPDGGGLRATTWKLLLGYLPPSRDLWGKEQTENRLKYAKLKEELLLNPTVRSHKEKRWSFEF